MRNDLLIYHRGLKGSENGSFLNEPDLARWTTCVRSLLIGSPKTVTGQHHDSVFEGVMATRFLTEIVAGLKSPMLGETEVHGQFKEFLKEHENKISSELFKELMSVHFLARRVRSDFLKNLGCQSYGSFARKKLRESSSLAILGSGQLATEIIPWLVKSREQVFLVSRNPQKVSQDLLVYENLKVVDYESLPRRVEGLVVTAPLASENIHALFGMDQPQLTIDFRAESRKDPLQKSFNPIALDDVFSEIETQKAQVESQIKKAKDFISEASSDLDSVIGRHLRSIKVS